MNLFKRFNNIEVPEMPEDEHEWKRMIWMAVYNHIPTKLRFIELRFNFNWVFMALVLALLGCLIGMHAAG